MTTRLLDVGDARPQGPGCGTARSVGDTRIALFTVGGSVFAIEDYCARCGASLTGGSLAGAVATCPGCGWHYDVATGSSIEVPAIRLHTFPVRVTATRLLVEWTEPAA